MKDPQQWYWELSAKHASLSKRIEDLKDDFSSNVDRTSRIRAEIVREHSYEEAINAFESDKTSYELHMLMLGMNERELKHTITLMEALKEEYGPLNELHPALIDAAFRDDIPPAMA